MASNLVTLCARLTSDGTGGISVEQEIKRSHLLGFAARTDTEAEVRAVIEAQRRRYPDARHHCTAFTFLPDGPDSRAQPVTRSSDDGEPSGTVGRPMPETLLGSGLQNVTVVVTRYFGGIKLGTDGLVRAYSGAIAAVLAGAAQVRVSRLPVVASEVSLSQAAALEPWLRPRGWAPLAMDWGAPLGAILGAGGAGMTPYETALLGVSRGGDPTTIFRLALDGVTEAELTIALSEQLAARVELHHAGVQVVESNV